MKKKVEKAAHKMIEWEEEEDSRCENVYSIE